MNWSFRGRARTPAVRILLAAVLAAVVVGVPTLAFAEPPATPSISGTADVGQTLTATGADATVIYEWYREDVDGRQTVIEGEVVSTYVVKEADRRHRLLVRAENP